MTTASVLAANAAPASAAPLHVDLRTVLIITALLEGFDAASSVPTLFGDMSEIPGPASHLLQSGRGHHLRDRRQHLRVLI
jgi:hypothetical protein